jgi:ribosomal protein S18 acetylase RimI-like enzyme
MEIQTATPENAALISAHRRAMFAEMQSADEAALDVLEQASIPWTEQRIREGKYLGWIAMDGEQIAASAGLLILDTPPNPLDPDGTQRAHLLNVFVEQAYRKRGLARELVQLCIHEAQRRKIRVVTLHASDAGRPLYEALGFEATNEMRLTLAGD